MMAVMPNHSGARRASQLLPCRVTACASALPQRLCKVHIGCLALLRGICMGSDLVRQPNKHQTVRRIEIALQVMLTQHAVRQGVPGHVYAHVLAHRIRSGRVSVDLSDGHLEPVKTAGAMHPHPNPNPDPHPHINPNPNPNTLTLLRQDRRCAAHTYATSSVQRAGRHLFRILITQTVVGFKIHTVDWCTTKKHCPAYWHAHFDMRNVKIARHRVTTP